MSVALKGVEGVQSVHVSLSKGEADVDFAPGNNVRYEQLLRAIEKNGFVMKGSTLVADGTLEALGNRLTLNISGSKQQLKLEPSQPTASAPATAAGKTVEVNGRVPEVAKGQSVDTLLYSAITEK